MTPIVIAGAGPVAQSLGWLLGRAGFEVRAVASRVRSRALDAAAFMGAGAAVDYEDIGRYSVPVLIAVTDSALPDVVTRIASVRGSASVALHTCGTAGPGVLEPLARGGWSVGVMHPIQTVPTREHGTRALPDATFGVGGDELAVSTAQAFVRALGARSVRVRADAFPMYHAAAVVAGNGVFALLEAASTMMARAGIDRAEARRIIEPLARASMENALGPDSEYRLTGPVARGDVATVRAHVQALEGPLHQSGSDAKSDEARLYAALTSWLLQIARRRGLPAASDQSIAELTGSSRQGDTL